MKPIAKILCLVLLISALGIPASLWSSSASASATTLNSAASSAPNQVHTVAPPAGDLPLRFDHVATEQGLSNLDVWDVLLDDQGFMWFATLDGLDRYDGYQMRVFKHDHEDPHSLSENTIRTLYQDRSGTLWIGTWTSGLERFDRNTESFTHFRHNPDDPNSLGTDSVFAILEDRAGQIWLGTRGGGLDRFDPITQTFTHYRHDANNPQSLSNDKVFNLLEDHDGMLWVGTDGGLNRLDPATGTFTTYRNDPANPASLSNDEVRALHLDDDGMLWVGTFGGGLDRLDLNQVKAGEQPLFTHYRHDPDDAQSLSDDNVFSIQRDVHGRLWIGTLGGGLNLLDAKTGAFQHYPANETAPQDFAAHRVYRMAEDARALWQGTDNGVYLLDLRPKPFYTFAHDPNDPNSLAGSVLDFVYQDPQGIVWASTTHSGLNRIDRSAHTVTHYRHDPNNPDSVGLDDIWDIRPSRDGGLWLATYGAGLDKFDPKTETFTHYRHDPADANSLASDLTTSVYEDPTGVVWIGTWDAGVDRFDPTTQVFIHFPHNPADPNSLDDNAVMSFDPDRNGGLWVGTLAGVNRITPGTGTIVRYPLNSQNESTSDATGVSSIHEARNGEIWVASYGEGLYHLNPAGEVIRHYSQKDGIPSDAVFSILEDSQGRFWLSTSHGLSRFDPATGTFRNFDREDGLPGNSFKQAIAFQGLHGEMFFGGKDGLVSFFPDQIQDNPTVPPVVITHFLLANKPVPISSGSVLTRSILATNDLTLSYQDRVISFEFAALNYIAPQKNRYRYLLQGFDQEWTEVGSDRRLVTYTNLDPGEYVFRVIGSNNDGVWNETGASLRLTITPPWWETTWFRVTLAAIVVGLVAGGFVLQRRRAVQQQRKLEAMVVERTRELQDARTQINTLFDTSPLGICAATIEGKIIGVNRALQRMTGYSEDELLQSNVTVLYAYPEQRVHLLEQLKAAGFLSNYGIQFRRRDDSHYFASLSLSQLELAGQTVLLGVTEDVTAQVEARQALTTLNQMSYDMASITDLAALVDHAVPHLHQIVDFQRAALMLIEDGEETLTIYVYTSPTSPPELILRQVPISSFPSLRSVLTGRETDYVPDMQASAAIQAELDNIQMKQWLAALKATSSWLGLPLVAGEHTIGLLNLLHDKADQFSAGDIELARTFANQLAVAIDNIHLKEQAGLSAAADERSRIARELHDSVTQTLFTASVLAEATPRIWNKDQNIARQNMEKLSLLIRGALAEMRSLLLELRLDTPLNQTLHQLLNTLAEATRARANLTVSLNVEGDRPLPAEVTLALYRITQEALNNVIRHAEATRVDMTLLSKPDRVELYLRDDGRGFDPDAIPNGHLGVSIMRERAAKIGASVRIESKPGHGTEVIATWLDPVERASHE
jgi:PAS domain S-box-containing protein